MCFVQCGILAPSEAGTIMITSSQSRSERKPCTLLNFESSVPNNILQRFKAESLFWCKGNQQCKCYSTKLKYLNFYPGEVVSSSCTFMMYFYVICFLKNISVQPAACSGGHMIDLACLRMYTSFITLHVLSCQNTCILGILNNSKWIIAHANIEIANKPVFHEKNKKFKLADVAVFTVILYNVMFTHQVV